MEKATAEQLSNIRYLDIRAFDMAAITQKSKQASKRSSTTFACDILVRRAHHHIRSFPRGADVSIRERLSINHNPIAIHPVAWSFRHRTTSTQTEPHVLPHLTLFYAKPRRQSCQAHVSDNFKPKLFSCRPDRNVIGDGVPFTTSRFSRARPSAASCSYSIRSFEIVRQGPRTLSNTVNSTCHGSDSPDSAGRKEGLILGGVR